MSEKLSQLHQELAAKLLERVRDPKVKSSDLNLARQFIKHNGIDAIPVDNSPLKKLMEELPFNDRPIKVNTN